MNSTLNNTIEKHLSLIGMIIAAIGLLATILAALVPIEYTGIISSLAPGGVSLRGYDKIGRLGTFNLIMYLMLIAGSWSLRNRGKDYSGLMRFVFSLIFYASLMGAINGFTFLTAGLTGAFKFPGIHIILLQLFWLGYRILIILFAFKVVKILDSPFAAILEERENRKGIYHIPVKARHRIRFVHLIIDFLVILSMASPIIFMMRVFQFNVKIGPDNQIGIALMILVLRLMYYLVFELFFDATPAKFLTGTRTVAAKTGETATAGDIVGRTFSRFIPFEAVSFLGPVGWHDSISNTTVALEDQRNYPRSRNWWWFLLALVTLIGNYSRGYIEEAIEDRRFSNFSQKVDDARQKEISENLNYDFVLFCEEIPYSRNNNRATIRVLKTLEDSLELELLEIHKDVQINQEQVVRAMKRQREYVPSKTAKTDLQKAFLENKTFTVNFKYESREYRIREVFTDNFPMIVKGNNTSSKRTKDGIDLSIQFRMQNKSATIQSIETLKGTPEWNDNFPKRVEIPDGKNSIHFYLNAEKAKHRQKHKSILTLEDDAGESYQFMIEGYGMSCFIYRTFPEN